MASNASGAGGVTGSGSTRVDCVLASISRKRRPPGPSNVDEKRGSEEGMSWWTCLLLGIPHDRSSPQHFPRTYHREADGTRSSSSGAPQCSDYSSTVHCREQ